MPFLEKIGKEEEVKQMLQEAAIFISMFDEIVSSLSEKEIIHYRNAIR